MNEASMPWAPLAVEAVAELFSTASFPWWIAGGLALELALGQRIRDHADIDLLILQRDHAVAREHLASWDCWAADPPGTLRAWPVAEALDASVHDVWCRATPTKPWALQLMLDGAKENRWVSRRDPGVSAPLEKITRINAAGVPYLAPHIQLYYKAKSIRPKDQLDFEAVTRSDVELDCRWLRQAIISSYGEQHPWLSEI